MAAPGTLFYMVVFLWSDVVYQKGSMWHEVGTIQSDNKGGDTGQSWPGALA